MGHVGTQTRSAGFDMRKIAFKVTPTPHHPMKNIVKEKMEPEITEQLCVNFSCKIDVKREMIAHSYMRSKMTIASAVKRKNTLPRKTQRNQKELVSKKVTEEMKWQL